MKKNSPNVQRSSSNQQKKKMKKRFLIELIIGLIILFVAVILGFLRESILIHGLYKVIEIRPNSTGYNLWLKPPIKMTRDYFLFNISNPTEIIQKPSTTTIIVNQTRRYPYEYEARKEHVQWSDDKKLLSYSVYRNFRRHPQRFDPSFDNETGVFIDMLRAIFRSQFGANTPSSFFALAGQKTFYHRKAVEQLEGFTSDLFYLMQDKMTGPNKEKYGFIYGYNGSRAYNYTIKAGLMEKGQVISFASESLPFSFKSSEKFNFTVYDGLTFVPMLFDKPSMNIFQAEFCRPVRAQFNRVVNMFGGISAHEYVVRLINFEACTDPNDIQSCPEVDMLDISKCISSSLPANTVLLSKVHFYGTKSETIEKLNIKGFTPIRDQHEALIYFDPYTGTPLRAHHRVQLNINTKIDRMRVIDDQGNIQATGNRPSERLLPIVWIDQEVNVDQAVLSKIRVVHLVFRYGFIFIVGFAIILIVIIIGVIEILARRAQQTRRINRAGNPKTKNLLQK